MDQPNSNNSVTTVLLIEDDPLLAKMYATKFEKESFRVLIASNGEDGLRMALEEKVDIVLLDMILPKITGHELLERLRTDPRGKELPVIVLSNLTDRDEAEKAYTLGVKAYLAKAMHDPEDIVNKVKEFLPSHTTR